MVVVKKVCNCGGVDRGSCSAESNSVSGDNNDSSGNSGGGKGTVMTVAR